MEDHRRRLFRYLLLLLVSLATVGLPLAAVGQSAPDAGPQGEGPWVVRAYYSERQMVNDLAAWLEPWEVHHDEGYLVVAVDRAQYEQMSGAGFRIEIDQSLTNELNKPHQMLPDQESGLTGYPCYRTVEETFVTAQEIVTTYPHLASWFDAGDSWEKTEPGGNPGYDLMVLRLTHSAIPGPKPKLFVMTSVHAREYAPPELATRFAENLVQDYGLDPDVTWLLDHQEIHLLLLANPDGRKHAEAGQSWRKNTNEAYCSPTSSYRGADLNRNFDYQWACCGGSSGAECAETYRGPAAASEPETQAIQNYLRNEFPDQRGPGLSDPAPEDATGVVLDIHAYGELVLWPWGFTTTSPANGTALQSLGRKLAYFSGYTPQQGIDLYPTDGASDDFAYGDLGLAAYTLELGTAFFQDCATFEDTILPHNLPALLYAAKVSRSPYQMPAGPDALSVSPSTGTAEPGEAVQLRATIDDTRYNQTHGIEPTQKIAAAESYIDLPPWTVDDTAVSYPMLAVDGAYDEAVEAVVGLLDTTGLSPGRHMLYVRGQDGDGNWGPFSAAFLEIAPAARVYLPMVSRGD